jgi:hypothetical protein
MSVNVEFEDNLDANEAEGLLSETDGVIVYNIDNEMNTKNLTLRWSNDPDLKTSKLYVGKSLIVSKENDSIYGYLRFYYSDKVYWKEWKTTVKKGLCVNQ